MIATGKDLYRGTCASRGWVRSQAILQHNLALDADQARIRANAERQPRLGGSGCDFVARTMRQEMVAIDAKNEPKQAPESWPRA